MLSNGYTLRCRERGREMLSNGYTLRCREREREMLSNGYTLRCRERGKGKRKMQKESGVIDREIKWNRGVEEQCNKKGIERERGEEGGRSFFTTPVLPPPPPTHTHLCLSVRLSLSVSASLCLSIYLFLSLSLSLSLYSSHNLSFFFLFLCSIFDLFYYKARVYNPT